MSLKVTVRTVIIAAATLFLGWAGFSMTNDESSENQLKQSPLPRPISVELLGTAKKITGVAVPAHILTGKRPRFFQVDEPSVVTVILPGGRSVTLPAIPTVSSHCPRYTRNQLTLPCISRVFFLKTRTDTEFFLMRTDTEFSMRLFESLL